MTEQGFQRGLSALGTEGAKQARGRDLTSAALPPPPASPLPCLWLPPDCTQAKPFSHDTFGGPHGAQLRLP